MFHRQLQIMSINYRLNFSQFQIGFWMPCWIAIQVSYLVKSIQPLSGKYIGGAIGYNLILLSVEFDVFVSCFHFWYTFYQQFQPADRESLRTKFSRSKIPWFCSGTYKLSVIRKLIVIWNKITNSKIITFDDKMFYC